jgi:hypothetical protein
MNKETNIYCFLRAQEGEPASLLSGRQGREGRAGVEAQFDCRLDISNLHRHILCCWLFLVDIIILKALVELFLVLLNAF